MKRYARSGIAAALAIVVFLAGTAALGQQKQRTSENTAFLKKLLENRPDADLDKDGVLTFQEAQKARRNRPQNAAQRRFGNPPPTFADVAYGKHERHVLDFWQAKSDRPTPVFVWIHGGGFRGGNKASIPAGLLRPFLQSGVSCASIHYRLSQHAPYPAQMHDSARAVQFLRWKADQWNVDPQRFAAGGGSAGSGISQWLAFHDDMAQPKGSDAAARQSTRLCCAVPINMQSTYDPRQIKTIVPGTAYKHPALVQLFARPAGWDWDTDPVDAKLDALLKDASPITHLTKDDPPIFLIHYQRANSPGNIHHPNFGKHLSQAMGKLGIECVRKMDSDYGSMTEAYADMVRFVQKHFQGRPRQ